LRRNDYRIVAGNTSQTRPENRAFYPALDGLRAIAFFMVLLQHYLSLPWGWTGVNVFFVLSGFLITGILFDSRDDPHRARNFYVRRTLRIFPLYYGIFLALLLTTPLFHWHWTWAWLAWPLYLGNLLFFLSRQTSVMASPQNMAAGAHLEGTLFPRTALFFGHFWSLCVEEQFYLLWPWVVFWIRSRRALLWICGVTVIAVPLLRVYTQHHAPAWMLNNELLYRGTPFQFDSLLLGGFVALMWRGPHRAFIARLGRIVAWLAAVAAIVYLARTLHVANPDWRKAYVYPAWRLTWGLSFVNVSTAAVIVCCLQSHGWLVRLLALRPLRWVGRISYGAYVFHDIFHIPLLNLCFRLAHRIHFAYAHIELTLTLCALATTFLLAWLSFRFFETPFLNLKERLTVRP
jgi:peptidoglycan/LPS O-acetylase OafA/YrhL